MAVFKTVLICLVVRLVRFPFTGPVLEAIALYMARRLPDQRIVRWLVFHVGRALRTVPWEEGTRIARLPQGFRLIVNVHDIQASHIYFYGTYEPMVTRLFTALTPVSGVVFDVGANLGFYTCLAGALVGQHGRVHSFEADQQVCAFLRRSVALNDWNDRIIVNEKAVYNESNTVLSFYTSPTMEDKGLGSLVREHRWGSFDNSTAVETISIDDYVRLHPITHVDIMKIDIEGAEIRAVEGMKTLLGQSPPTVILMEVVSDGLVPPRVLAGFLSGYGYSPFLILEDRLQAASELEIDAIEYGNVLFARSVDVHRLHLESFM